MKDEKFLPGSPEDVPPQQKVDELIKALRRAKRRFRGSGHPGLVEVNSALDVALQIRLHVHQKPTKKANWNEVIRSLSYVVRLAIDLYSLFSYILQPQREKNAFWDHFKNAARRGRSIAAGFGKKTKNCTYLPISN